MPLSKVDKVNAVSQSLGMEIHTAYEAYWFLHDHPVFILPERDPISAEDAKKLKNTKEYLIIQDAGGNYWREWILLKKHAINSNLEISYHMVDETGRINDDHSKNLYQECWLEFGQIEWGYYTEEQKQEHERCMEMPYHDVELDCGAPSFDEALIQLANLVLKRYGPIPPKK